MSYPLELQDPWVSELGYFDLRAGERGQRTDLLRYFDRAFELARAHPSEGVLKYAVGKAANLGVRPDNRILFQDLLLQCAAVEPGCLPMILRVLCRFRAEEDAANAALLNSLKVWQRRLIKKAKVHEKVFWNGRKTHS